MRLRAALKRQVKKRSRENDFKRMIEVVDCVMKAQEAIVTASLQDGKRKG